MTPGGVIEKAAPVDVSNVMLVCPVCKRRRASGSKVKDVKGEHGARARLQARRLRPGDRPVMADRRPTAPRLKERYDDELRAAAEGGARPELDHAGAADREDHAQHGRRRGEDRREGARRRDRGADDHRRPARAGAPRPQVDRELQDPRGHADRRARDAARRAHVRVPRPADLDRAAAHPRLPRAQPAARSTAAATTRSASASRSSSRRSTTTRSRRSAASTSRSRPRADDGRAGAARSCAASGCRSRPTTEGSQ